MRGFRIFVIIFIENIKIYPKNQLLFFFFLYKFFFKIIPKLMLLVHQLNFPYRKNRKKGKWDKIEIIVNGGLVGKKENLHTNCFI